MLMLYICVCRMKQQLAADNMIMNGQAVVKTYYLLISRLTLFDIHSVLKSNIDEWVQVLDRKNG